MKNYYAKQFQAGADVKVHIFRSMQERDAWVKEQYDYWVQDNALRLKQGNEPSLGSLIEH